jgi:Zn finger protein HypA/HybF involved in hydrogenase expression
MSLKDPSHCVMLGRYLAIHIPPLVLKCRNCKFQKGSDASPAHGVESVRFRYVAPTDAEMGKVVCPKCGSEDIVRL